MLASLLILPYLFHPLTLSRRAEKVYLSTYFVDDGEAGVYLAESVDGLDWHPLVDPNIPLLKPEVGGKIMRDTCVFQGPDLKWTAVWTSGGFEQGIGLARSEDLVHWSSESEVPVMQGSGAINAWAPEITYDNKARDYVIFWSSTIPGKYPDLQNDDGDFGPNHVPLNHRYYYTTTTDFVNYSASKLLWDPGFDCIDATLLHDRNDWLMFGKNETKSPIPAKYIFVAKGPSPLGPFKIIDPKITGNYWSEGPTSIKVGKDYKVYFDEYTEGRWGMVSSKDLIHWADKSPILHMVHGARHGTVFVEPLSFANQLAKSLQASN